MLEGVDGRFLVEREAGNRFSLDSVHKTNTYRGGRARYMLVAHSDEQPPEISAEARQPDSIFGKTLQDTVASSSILSLTPKFRSSCGINGIQTTSSPSMQLQPYKKRGT